MARNDPIDDLRAFVTGLQGLLKSDDSYESIAPSGVARKILESMTGFLNGKHTSLDQALGLKRSKGRPTAAGAADIPDRIVRAWRMAAYGKAPWIEIARAIDHQGDPNDLRKKVERHHEAISRMEADRMFSELQSDDGHKMQGI